MKVFTAWSIGSSTATGVLVMLVVGQLMGAPWVLAALNGLAIGAVALLVACGIRLDLFRRAPRDPAAMLRWRPQHGVGMVGSLILSAPASFAVLSIELELASEAALSLLFLATGFAAYLTGSLVATLEHLDDEIRPPQAPDHAE